MTTERKDPIVPGMGTKKKPFYLVGEPEVLITRITNQAWENALYKEIYIDYGYNGSFIVQVDPEKSHKEGGVCFSCTQVRGGPRRFNEKTESIRLKIEELFTSIVNNNF
jgi:hypothetical protein